MDPQDDEPEAPKASSIKRLDGSVETRKHSQRPAAARPQQATSALVMSLDGGDGGSPSGGGGGPCAELQVHQIAQLAGMTGADVDTARALLERAGWNIELAANAFFESPAAGSGAHIMELSVRRQEHMQRTALQEQMQQTALQLAFDSTPSPSSLSATAQLVNTPAVRCETTLMTAASAGNASAIRALLATRGQSLEELDTQDREGYTAFMWACERANNECVTALIEYGCDVKVRSVTKGRAGLALAAMSGSADTVRAVLAAPEAGLLVEATDKYGCTPYLLAMEKGALECALALVENRPRCNTLAKSTTRRTALMIGAMTGSTQTLRFALATDGIDLDAVDAEGCTAFHWVCEMGHANCIPLLVEAGCKTDGRTNAGATALMCATRPGSVPTVKVLLRTPNVKVEARDVDGFTAYLWAAEKGHAECITALAEGGCDTTAESTQRKNALMFAASSGNIAAVEAVLKTGPAKVDARDQNGFTAFLWACEQGSLTCIEKIRGLGFDTSVRTVNAKTALMCAAASGSAEAVRSVLENDEPEIEVVDTSGCSAFIWACDQGNEEAVRLLGEAGADPTKVTVKGRTALMRAASSGSAGATRAVLERGGVDLEAAGEDGGTAFLWACDQGHGACIIVLVEAGCITTVRDATGRTGLMLAIMAKSVLAVRAVLAIDDGMDLEAKDRHGLTAYLLACEKG